MDIAKAISVPLITPITPLNTPSPSSVVADGLPNSLPTQPVSAASSLSPLDVQQLPASPYPPGTQAPAAAPLKKTADDDVELEFFFIETEASLPTRRAYHVPRLSDESREKLVKFCGEVIHATHAPQFEYDTLSTIYKFYSAVKEGKPAPALTKPLQDAHGLDPYANPNPVFVLNEHQKNRAMKQKYIAAQLRLIRGLTSISSMLISMNLKVKELKSTPALFDIEVLRSCYGVDAALKHCLTLLNNDKAFISGIYTAALSPDGNPVRVLRILAQEAIALNSRDRVCFVFMYLFSHDGFSLALFFFYIGSLSVECGSGESRRSATHGDQQRNS